MNEYRISVVVPIYNVAAYLPDLLEDLIGQTLPFYEIIAVDDASPDQCGEIADQYALRCPQVKPLHLETNGGLSNARNRGLEQVNGDYVLFLDADDRVARDLNERLQAALSEQESDVTLFGLREEYYGKNGALRKTVDIIPAQTGCFTGKEQIFPQIPLLEEQTLFGYAWNKLYRTALLKQNGLFFEQVKLIEDVCFNIKVFSYAQSLHIMEETPYRYRKNTESESLTGKFLPDYFSLNRRRIALMFDLLCSGQQPDSRTEDILGTVLVRYLFSALSRNCDKRSGYTRQQRRKFLTDCYGDPLFVRLIPAAKGKGRLSAMLCRLIQKKRTGLCLAVGWLIYLVKTKLPLLFAGLKQ